jgi:AMP-binding enzyme
MRYRMRRDQGLSGRRGARPDRLRRACTLCRAVRGWVVGVGGAVVAPIMTMIRPRELERTPDQLAASVYVSRWTSGQESPTLRRYGRSLARLPTMRHRVVIETPAEREIEFGSFFEERPWEQRHPVALANMAEDPDRVATVLFDSGTTGEPKGALQTRNTCYSSASAMIEASAIMRQDVHLTTHSLTHAVRRGFSQESLLAGACMVLLNPWSGERGLSVLAGSGTTHLLLPQRRGHGGIAVQLPSDDVGSGRWGLVVARAARRGRPVDPGGAQPRPGEPGSARGKSGGVLSRPAAIVRRRSCR